MTSPDPREEMYRKARPYRIVAFPPAEGQRLLSAQARFYIVQRGDTLSAIGLKLGVCWRALARRNCLRNPHLIHPGQMIAFGDRV